MIRPSGHSQVSRARGDDVGSGAIGGINDQRRGIEFHGCGAQVSACDLAIGTGVDTTVDSDAEGRYRFDVAATGAYLLIVNYPGFAEAARTVVLESADRDVDLPISLELGVLSDEITVTASRAEREVRRIPLHVETLSRAALERSNATSTGDAMSAAVNLTPVGGVCRPAAAA